MSVVPFPSGSRRVLLTRHEIQLLADAMEREALTQRKISRSELCEALNRVSDLRTLALVYPK